MKYLRRDLKVCEGCGGLWVRAAEETAGVYCRHCRPLMADLPPRRRLRPGRPCRVTSQELAKTLPGQSAMSELQAAPEQAQGGLR